MPAILDKSLLYISTETKRWKREKRDGKIKKILATESDKGACTTVGFKLNNSDAFLFLGHFASTDTHWSDHLTSCQLVTCYCSSSLENQGKNWMDLTESQF
eukprot:Pompholyxophrys_punicea_v1_NODE_449_length_1940_cov_43.896552.p2 type:complete len:101 gc:universal NODE_449_length_1940_cov_43.896552:959-1261(+)